MPTTPVIVFDHFENVATVAGTDPNAAQKLAETIDRQRHAVTAGGSQPAEQHPDAR